MDPHLYGRICMLYTAVCESIGPYRVIQSHTESSWKSHVIEIKMELKETDSADRLLLWNMGHGTCHQRIVPES